MRNEKDLLSAGSKSSGIARAAMWLGGSALFGSLALVLWNRRALKSMHEASEVLEEPVIFSDDDIY
jgi:hypothetical protein